MDTSLVSFLNEAFSAWEPYEVYAFGLAAGAVVLFFVYAGKALYRIADAMCKMFLDRKTNNP